MSPGMHQYRVIVGYAVIQPKRSRLVSRGWTLCYFTLFGGI